MRNFLLVVFVLSSISCFSQQNSDKIKLSYQGSSTVGNFIMDSESIFTEVDFTVDTKPESSGGEMAIMEGRTDLGGIARFPSKEVLSSGVTSTLIGFDAIAIVVNVDNPVKNLTQSQLKMIYLGEITNWNELGGEDLGITPYIVGPESATRKVCRSIILGKDDYKVYQEITPDVDIIDRVQNDRGGIGQISFSFTKENEQVKVLSINGQTLTLTNQHYPITRPLYLLWWQGRKDVARYVQWAVSNEGQRIVMNRFIGLNESATKMQDETGKLVVYTKTSPIEDGGIFYYPHDGYEVLQLDKTLLFTIPNQSSRNDESPTRVELVPGPYIVRINKGGVSEEFSINIQGGKLLQLYPERKENPFGYLDHQNPLTRPTKVNSSSNEEQRFEFFGDFRVRGEEDIRTDYNRFRGRFRIRAGMYANFSPQLKVEFRVVSTGDPNNPNSSHVNLNGGFNQIKVAFDRAFVHYHSQNNPSFDAWIGKFSNPNTSSKIYSETLWDADIQPEGVAFSLQKKWLKKTSKLKFTNGLYLLSQFRTGTTKNWLLTSQVSTDIAITKKWSLTAATGIYYFENIKALNVNPQFIDNNDGNSFYENTIIEHGDTITTKHYATHFYVLDPFVLLKTNALKKPLLFKFQWFQNVGAKEDNHGYSSGVSYGGLKNNKDWLFYYQYNYLEQDALFSPFSQDDALSRTNTEGHVFGIAHRFHKRISLQLWSLANRSLEDNKIETRVRLDMNVKF